MTPFEIKLINLCSGQSIPFTEQFIEMVPEIVALIEKELGANRHWISVDDRLPEKPMRCLIFAGGSITEAIYRQSESGFFVDGADDVPRAVTHWMPLPQPPQDGLEK